MLQLTGFHALLASVPLALAGARGDEAAFLEGLARVDELVGAEEWGAAKETLLALVAAEEGSEYVVLERPRIVEVLGLCAFRAERELPRTEELISGELSFHGGSGGSIKVKVGRSKLTAWYDGKKVLSGKKPSDVFGWMGFTGMAGFEELTLEGKAECSWVEGLLDTRIDELRRAFEEEHDVEALLPDWLAPAAPTYDLASISIPDVAGRERATADLDDEALRGREFAERALCVTAGKSFEVSMRRFSKTLGLPLPEKGAKHAVYLFAGQRGYARYVQDVLFSPRRTRPACTARRWGSS